MFSNACIHAEDDLLDISFDLTDKEGILAAKMKISLSCISRSGVYIEEIMKMVDDHEVALMSRLPNNLTTLGEVLQLTKALMDQFSQVVHLSRLNLIIALIEVIRYTRYSMHRGPFFPFFTW
jgi:hypothetical protein